MKKKNNPKKFKKQPQPNGRLRWIFLGFCFFILAIALINALDSASDKSAASLTLANQIRNRAPSESVEGIMQRFFEQEEARGTQIMAGSLLALTPEAVAGLNAQEPAKEQATAQGKEPPAMQRCFDQKLGFRILCDPKWSYQEYKDAILLIISSEPAVTMTVAKIKSDIRFIGQLNRDKLLALGQYANGFQVEDARLADQKAVLVKGFSQRYPSIRLLDYYLLHDNQLYGVMLSCNPKESWDDYKFLMQKIIASFTFEDREAEEDDLSKVLHTPEAEP